MTRLHALDGRLVPRLTDDARFGLGDADRRRGDAAEREPRPAHAAVPIAIDRHRRGDRADVVEPPLRDLVEAHELRQRLRDLDAVSISPGCIAVLR